MTTEQTAQQFELAAQIIRTGHPWEWQASDGEWVKPTIRTELHHVISDGLAIRLAFATPPDGRPLHNPGNLSAEQVGAGFRLTLKDESPHKNAELWNVFDKKWVNRLSHNGGSEYGKYNTYRLPLSVPWPEPEEPTLQLPPPPPGVQWHRTDGWQEGDLPQGWRPLVLDEESQPGDEHWASNVGPWKAVQIGGLIYNKLRVKCRTRRPLTFTHANKQWTWHRPGDPMPCDGTKRVIPLVCYGGKYSTGGNMEGSHWDWNDEYLIGWRYANEKKTVPLGPDDVPPGSVLLSSTAECNGMRWTSATCSKGEGIEINGRSCIPWIELMSHWQINRSIPLTGKWDTNAWEPCHKEVDA